MGVHGRSACARERPVATLNARAASNTSRRAGFAHFARWPDGPGRVEGAVPAEIDRQACAECARNPPALWSLRRGDSARQSGSGHATAGCSLHESGRMRGHTVADGTSAAPVTWTRPVSHDGPERPNMRARHRPKIQGGPGGAFQARSRSQRSEGGIADHRPVSGRDGVSRGGSVLWSGARCAWSRARHHEEVAGVT